MKGISEETLIFEKEFTRQEPLPQAAIDRVTEILQSGRLHRYNTVKGEVAEASLLEQEYADYVGSTYCAGFSSCGSAIYVALKSVGVRPGDKVLSNAFTLAPVPGAIKNAEAVPVFVEITEDYVTDLNDLEKKAKESQAKYFLLSHMRGHIVDMDRIMEICNRYGIVVVEDCAHTMGATWDGKFTGTFGKVGCFSAQTYKHLNSGEGGLLITDDADVAAQAILYSGSYMLYEKHIARPKVEVFEKYKKLTPNFSLRMSNLVAALIRVQLPSLKRQGERWNERYKVIEAELTDVERIYLPKRPAKEGYVASSFQFTLKNTSVEKVEAFIKVCADRGVELKWFGSMEPKGFTSRYESWEYFGETEQLPKTAEVLNFMCDFRLPLTFSLEDCRKIAKIIKQVVIEVIE
ncbi:DegT/DnrJ/EryC1/StrS family aminotransferase [Virgibacillus halodenitrificans]|uniref:Aminotransferase class I/II-fold pyridoxal phosphate-dependent enzyme n=1 Tax=Virgibacillus halodenitrificans TaxID=1482 RepID=A0ABR7VGI7_VIRHA|nr:aminotransferase class I/II-fold pyridoxal phosphate-dependent enzyme [Virgibacillus halodenitrificans]MBD1221069.1 aminotransferase class I/II-fold pyridoxal phosphate-dependent enzyme [Virgibacillus halodenitrificans]